MAKKQPQPQRELKTQLHWASIEKVSSPFLSPFFLPPFARTSLIFSIHDTDWIGWYIFSEGDLTGPPGFADVLASAGNTLDSDHNFGWSNGAWTFRPRKPRTVGEFNNGPQGNMYSIVPRAQVLIQRIAPSQLRVGMTVYLSDGMEQLTWHSINTHLRHQKGVGMLRGTNRFRLPNKLHTRVP
jgi:hypothetical protein